MSLSFLSHERGCSPLSPCRNCRVLIWIRKKLSESEYAELESMVSDLFRPEAELKYVKDRIRPEQMDRNSFLESRVADINYDLPAPARRILSDKKIKEVVILSDAEFLSIENLGRKSLNAFKELFARQGMHFGITLE